MVAALDRVRVTWEGTGTFSPISLGSAISSVFFAPTAALDGLEVSYLIEHTGEGIFEVEWGRGVYTHSGATLARTTIVGSTNGGIGGSLVNFSEGVKHVSITIHAGDLQGRFISALPTGTIDGAADFLAFVDATDGLLKKILANNLPSAQATAPSVFTAEVDPEAAGVFPLSTALRAKPENVLIVTDEDFTVFEVPEDFAPAVFEILLLHSDCTVAIENDPDGRIINGVQNGDPVALGPSGSTVRVHVLGSNHIRIEGETAEASEALAPIDMAGFALRNVLFESEKLQKPSSSSGTLAVDLSDGTEIEVTLTEDITTHTLSSVPSTDRRVSITYRVIQGSTASPPEDHTMVWPAAFDWGLGRRAHAIERRGGRHDRHGLHGRRRLEVARHAVLGPVMLIARYDPRTFELVETITSFAQFKAAFPDKSWVDPVTDGHLIRQDVPARVAQEVAPPTLGYGERATSTAQRQQDGSWLQVWSVESITVGEARGQLLNRADSLLRDRVPLVNPVLLHVFMELQVAETEVAAGLTPDAARYPLIQAIAQARSITIEQAAVDVVRPLRDAWRGEAAKYIAKYTEVVASIAAAETKEDAKAIFDELEAIE